MKMMLAAMLLYTFHSTFEDAEKSFNSIGVYRAVFRMNVFATAMVYNSVFREMFLNADILPSIVRHDAGLAVDVFSNARENGCRFQVINNHTASAASIAIDQAKNFIFVSVPASLLDTARLNG